MKRKRPDTALIADRQVKPEGIAIGVEFKRCDECKRGEREARWKGAGMGDYYCSLCQHTISGRTKFCPECGAKMDEWEEAEDG